MLKTEYYNARIVALTTVLLNFMPSVMLVLVQRQIDADVSESSLPTSSWSLTSGL